MKKRSSKKAPKKTKTADECAAYRDQISEFVDEVDTFMERDETLKRRIDTAKGASCINREKHIHHIMGRSQVHPESDWFCNLVQLSKCSHDCGHDYSPTSLEICSLMAKWERHQRYLALVEVGIVQSVDHLPNRLHWNIEALGKICGSPTLAGRIEGILLPKLVGTVFEKMCEFLLAKIAKETKNVDVQ